MSAFSTKPTVKNSPNINYWDYEKNTDISPEEITLGSEKKVWWKCPLGHSFYRSIINQDKSKNKCPICFAESQTSFYEQALLFYCNQKTKAESRTKLNNIEFDIYLPLLKIAIEYNGEYWHRNKSSQKKIDFCNNNDIFLFIIEESYKIKRKTVFEGEKICIIQANPSTDFSFIVNAIFNKIGWENILNPLSPNDSLLIIKSYITSRKTYNLLTEFPEVAKEWNYEKNYPLIPEMFYPKSGKKVWWKCKNNHEWVSKIDSRTRIQHNCPYCSNQKIIKGQTDFGSNFPNALLNWDYTKNQISPFDYAPFSPKEVWWKCHLCGYESKATIQSRAKGQQCRCCHGTFKPIIQKDKQGQILNYWNNLPDIKHNSPYDASSVFNCCEKKKYYKTHHGFLWEYGDDSLSFINRNITLK